MLKTKRANALFYAAVQELYAKGGLYRQGEIAQMIGCKDARLSSYLNNRVVPDQVELLLRLLDRLDLAAVQKILGEGAPPGAASARYIVAKTAEEAFQREKEPSSDFAIKLITKGDGLMHENLNGEP